jgi:hypothetical protein
MHNRLATVLSITALLLFCPIVASAQASRAAADPDMKELAAYTLTMDTLNRIDRANRLMVANLQKDPKYAERIALGKELDALNKKDEPTDAENKRIEQIQARIDQLDAADDQDDDDDGPDQTLSDMERKIAGIAPLAAALKAEGVSPREYAKFTMAMLQAGFAAAGQQMAEKMGKTFQLPAGVNPANVKFVHDHEADIKKMQEAYQASSIK